MLVLSCEFSRRPVRVDRIDIPKDSIVVTLHRKIGPVRRVRMGLCVCHSVTRLHATMLVVFILWVRFVGPTKNISIENGQYRLCVRDLGGGELV